MVVCRNQAGSARARVTFQVSKRFQAQIHYSLMALRLALLLKFLLLRGASQIQPKAPAAHAHTKKEEENRHEIRKRQTFKDSDQGN